MPKHHRLIPPDEPERPARPGTLRRILSIFRPYRRRMYLVAVLILVTAGLGLINPLLIKVVFDDVIGGTGEHGDRVRLLLLVTGIMVITPIVSRTLGL